MSNLIADVFKTMLSLLQLQSVWNFYQCLLFLNPPLPVAEKQSHAHKFLHHGAFPRKPKLMFKVLLHTETAIIKVFLDEFNSFEGMTRVQHPYWKCNQTMHTKQ
jgi:hypothetical protein